MVAECQFQGRCQAVEPSYRSAVIMIHGVRLATAATSRAGALQAAAPARRGAEPAPARGASTAILGLQHDAGNRATSALVQRLRLSHAPSAVLQRCGSHPCPASGCAGTDREELTTPGRPMLARTAVHGGGRDRAGVAPPVVNRVLCSGGQSLDAASRSEMEAHFGQGFGDVRLHTGAEAARSARAVGATAYTVGNHVVMGDGYVPGSPAAQRTLAHELVHVIQQEGAAPAVQGETPVLDAADPLEQEAHAVADRLTSGGTVDVAGRARGLAVHRQPASDRPASLEARVAAFHRLVKNAGKVRMAENARALEEWRHFLQQQLTPAQVQTQVHAEEVRSILDRAARVGPAEVAVAEQWLRTPGPNRRWVLEQQIEGRYRACTGCHAAVRADELDRGILERRGELRTPLQQLPSGPFQRPRPSFAQIEQLTPTDQPKTFPDVAEAQSRVNAVQPYVRQLGPGGFQVLPPETLGSNASPGALMADITNRIARRLADYQEFSRRIDAPDFDYLDLRPIVRDLLPLAEPDVREAVEEAISRAETWETIKKIAVGAATIALLLLAIFPPTSAIGVAGALALGAAVGGYQIYQGYETFEQGQLYSLARGSQGVLDPGQLEAADAMMAIGALNMVLGSVGVASSALGAVRLIRAVAPPGGGAGALESVEGNAGGTLYRVTRWGTRDPRVTVIGPNGQVIRDGPLSSFRPSASATSAPGGAPSTGAGGYVYPTRGGAAMVAQQAPVVTPRPVPVPTPAPAAPAPPVTPHVGALLATTGTSSAIGVAAAAVIPRPQARPVMQAGLTPAQQALWRTCNQLHNTYKTIQEDAAAYAPRMDAIRKRIMEKTATAQDRIDFCGLLDERIRIVQRLHAQRLRYLQLGCDQFDWFNTGTTQAQREAAHRAELDNVDAQLGNLYELKTQLCT